MFCLILDTSGYIFIESSSPVAAGDRASLQSELYSVGEDICLSFFYSMNGELMGSLEVTLEVSESLKD